MKSILPDRKEQINKNAQNLFRTKGYKATSMRALAKTVGIEPASLYSHVASKEVLLQNICFQIADEFIHALKNISEEKLNPKEKLAAAIQAHIRIILKHLDATTVFFHEWKYMNSASLNRFKNLRNDYEQKFRNILESGIEEQIFQKTDPHTSIKLLFAMMNSIHEWYNPKGKLKQKDIVESILKSYLNGILEKQPKQNQ